MLITLKSRIDNDRARQRLEDKKCSALSYGIGDVFKSWDVDAVIDILDQNLTKDSTILDIGSFCSEMGPCLSLRGYKNLYGVDLNPEILKQPFNDKIRYAVGNFYHTAAVDSSFDAITAISVIEHGYDPDTMFAEISRLLKPGGLFIASYDYWPDKIPTDHVVSFGMSWVIFSKKEVEDMISHANQYGMSLFNETKDLEANEPHIRYNGFNYTFGLAVFKKQ